MPTRRFNGRTIEEVIFPVGYQVPVTGNADSGGVTPTTTSVPSSATSVQVLAANTNRKSFGVSNVSTAKLYLSYSTPATTANAFVEIPAGAYLPPDPQLKYTGAIYGIWASANGSAQVTEYV